MDIGATILFVSLAQREDVTDALCAWYQTLPVKASECIECGDCVECCPLGVAVVGKMRELVSLYET